ncbi:hypothetical protein D3C85_1494920 [compost metagenome]|jgi:hypothetical protein
MGTRGSATALLPLINDVEQTLSTQSFSPTAHLSLISRQIVGATHKVDLERLPDSGRSMLSRMMTIASKGLTGKVMDAENALAELRMSLVVFKTAIVKARAEKEAQEQSSPRF